MGATISYEAPRVIGRAKPYFQPPKTDGWRPTTLLLKATASLTKHFNHIILTGI